MRKLKQILILVIIVLLLPVLTWAATVSFSSGQHPRIWITAAEKTSLITACEGGGALRDQYLQVKNYIDTQSEATGNAYAHQRYWLSYVLVTMVEGGTYLTNLQSSILGWYNARNTTYRYSDYRLGAIAIIYDWLYSDLNTTDRQYIADIFVAWWDYWYGGSGDFHSTWNNHTHEETQAVIMGAIALYGDGYCDTEASINFTRAETWIDEFHNAYELSGGASSTLGLNGGWNEGIEYVQRGGYGLLGSLLAWKTGTDEDTLTNSATFSGLGKWIFHTYRNDTRFYAKSDSDVATISSELSQPAMSSLLYMLSDIFSDGYARYLWDTWEGDGTLTGEAGELSSAYDYMYIFYILFNNSTSAITPAAEDKSVMFDGMNEVFIRDGFNSDDTYFWYTNQDMFSGHEHFDAGHFSITRSDDLAIDAGAYEGGDTSPNNHAWLYYQRTLAHNCLTVYDPAETWTGEDWANNDGGQNSSWINSGNWSHYPDRYADFGSGFDMGGIIRWYSSPATNYFRGDISPAYGSKVSFYYREFIISGQYYINCDKVTAVNSSHTKRWLLHSVTEPSVSGDISTITNTDKLIIEAVLPSSPTITKRGGSGYEYWTTYDGTGLNPTFNTQYYGESPNEPGAWRLEISPSSTSTSDTFLNVMMAGDNTISMPVVNALSGAGYVGSHIEDSSENVIAVFNSAYSDSDNTSLSYTVTPTTGSRHIISGLQPSATYTVTGLSDQTADASGCIEFTDTVTTEKTYAIASTGPGPVSEAAIISAGGSCSRN